MGIFDQITDALGGGDSQQSVVMQLAMNLLQQQGGVQGLLEQFQQNGMGDLISSWVGTGANQALSTEQLQSALGSSRISELVQGSQLSENQLLSGLSDALPQLVDKLTPDGQASTGDDLLKQGLGALSKFF